MSDQYQQVYKRGQMEWALWSTFSRGLGVPKLGIPAIFRNRIKRMLELDAATEESTFVSREPDGSGSDAGYPAFGVFLMALGLVMLDAGFKQSDALFLLHHIRGPLRQEYEHVLKSPPAGRQQIFTGDRPLSPTRPDSKHVADTAVFLLIRKIEMSECWGRGTLPQPFILGPTFCRGLKELMIAMDQLNDQYPSTMVVEISDLIVVLNEWLSKAPASSRGRQRP